MAMLECTWKTCCLISTINQGSKVTSKKLSVLFCSAWSLPLYCKILNENIQRYRSDNQLKFQHQNSKKFLVQSFWKTSKFQMFIISEIQVRFKKFQLCLAQKPEIFSHYKIMWILVKVRWKIPILLDHLTWNDPLRLCEGVGIGNFGKFGVRYFISDSATLGAWVELGSWDATFDVITTTSDLMFSKVFLMFDVYAVNLMLKTIFMV